MIMRGRKSVNLVSKQPLILNHYHFEEVHFKYLTPEFRTTKFRVKCKYCIVNEEIGGVSASISVTSNSH